LLRLIEPHYPKAGQGRQPLGLEKMLRIYFLQQWFNLSDPQAEDAIYDSESMRRFARVELGDEVVPDESTILRFRHLLEQHGLTHAIFDAVADLLEERRLLLRSGTIVERDHYRGAEFDQEREREPRPRDEADPQGSQLALRDEAAHRRG
jgi:IS5 family transposase